MTRKEWIKKEEIIEFLVNKPIIITKNFLDSNIIELHIRESDYNLLMTKLTNRAVKK
jgi:hypothetical protein